MIEVFKTNVKCRDHANVLIDEIHRMFTGYEVNFDLEDCDKIMRVKCERGVVQVAVVEKFLNGFGFDAEVLPDEMYEAQISNLYLRGD
jgi:hypothetical protein